MGNHTPACREGEIDSDCPCEASSGALPWLLGCLDHAVQLLDEVGSNVDARVVEAHRAELARGHEWPGDPITSPDRVAYELDGLRVVNEQQT